ncbi:unnamed protein product [Lactuca saligna]|uniref:NAD(P)H dehydrogenase (quinone) n=1 Tax=Lactuca saligna TaxID=75948 RepID=A0AA35V3L4_LACSI|nr:unnamed protein product [Lactuca saligna]
MSIVNADISLLPTRNTDLEVNDKFPPEVEEFRQKIVQSECFLLASPEYNYMVTTPLKNAIDWVSRPPNVFVDKVAAIVSVGGGFGGGLAQYSLRQNGVFLDLHSINKPEFFLKGTKRTVVQEGFKNLAVHERRIEFDMEDRKR